MAPDIDTDAIFVQVSARLREKFPDRTASEVDESVRVELEELAERPVTDYLEVLTERAAKSRLTGAEPAPSAA